VVCSEWQKPWSRTRRRPQCDSTPNSTRTAVASISTPAPCACASSTKLGNPSQIHGEQQRATCPGGYTSISWTPAEDDRLNEVVKIKFSLKDCQPWASRVHCTRATRPTITVPRQDHHLALQAARARATSIAYTTEYARRADTEGTLSQGSRAYGLRHAFSKTDRATRLLLSNSPAISKSWKSPFSIIVDSLHCIHSHSDRDRARSWMRRSRSPGSSRPLIALSRRDVP
jgi:hypothetical protein